MKPHTPDYDKHAEYIAELQFMATWHRRRILKLRAALTAVLDHQVGARRLAEEALALSAEEYRPKKKPPEGG